MALERVAGLPRRRVLAQDEDSSRAAWISRTGRQSGTPESSRWIGRTISPSEAMSTIAQSL